MPMGAEPSGAEDHGRRSTPLTGCASDARPAGCRQQPWMMSWKDVGKAGLLTEASRGDFSFCLRCPWEEAVLTHRFFTIADDLDSYGILNPRARLLVKPAVRVSPHLLHTLQGKEIPRSPPHNLYLAQVQRHHNSSDHNSSDPQMHLRLASSEF